MIFERDTECLVLAILLGGNTLPWLCGTQLSVCSEVWEVVAVAGRKAMRVTLGCVLGSWKEVDPMEGNPSSKCDTSVTSFSSEVWRR